MCGTLFLLVFCVANGDKQTHPFFVLLISLITCVKCVLWNCKKKKKIQKNNPNTTLTDADQIPLHSKISSNAGADRPFDHRKVTDSKHWCLMKRLVLAHLVLGVSGSSCCDSQTDKIGLKITAWPQFTDPSIQICKRLISGKYLSTFCSVLFNFQKLQLFDMTDVRIAVGTCVLVATCTWGHHGHSSNCPFYASCCKEIVLARRPLGCLSEHVNIKGNKRGNWNYIVKN